MQGITIVINGKFKDVLDILKAKNPEYENYSELIRDALFEGINTMTEKNR